jgi:ribonuclease-3
MDRRAAAVAGLEAALGYVFADRGRLDVALTHASARRPRGADNDRLEFLGDRVLGLIIAEALVSRAPEASVGELTRRVHVLVSGDVCAQVAAALGLGPALRLAGGETRRGARIQASILADACEALIAALYLEAGLERTGEIVRRLWSPYLDAPLDPALANPKSELQEWAAARGLPAPTYRMLSRAGPDHSPRFVVEANIAGMAAVSAPGGSLREAEKAAALALLRGAKGEA